MDANLTKRNCLSLLLDFACDYADYEHLVLGGMRLTLPASLRGFADWEPEKTTGAPGFHLPSIYSFAVLSL